MVTTTIWSGLTLGAIYALVACGFNLSLLPSGVFNFAHGALVVAGAFLTYYWFTTLRLPLVVGLGLNAVAGAMLGVTCEVVTVRPLRRGAAALGGVKAELITTVGMSVAIAGTLGLEWGFGPRVIPFHGPTKVVTALGLYAEPAQIVLVISAIVIAVALSAWFHNSLAGRACLAVAEDRGAAMHRGVNVNLLSIGGFAAAGALAGISAMVIGPVTYAYPALGNTIAFGGFVAVATGGEGSFLGVLFGGFLVGLVASFGTRYLGGTWSDVSVLAVLLVTLAVRPKGFGGIVATRQV
jgi:branched-chain amino acid transport system permease protein